MPCLMCGKWKLGSQYIVRSCMGCKCAGRGTRREPRGEGEDCEGGRKTETRGTRTSDGGGREGREAIQRNGARGAAMNDSGSRITSGEASSGGSPRAPGRRPGNGTRPLVFLGNSRGDEACGVCRVSCNARAPGDEFPVWARAPHVVAVLHARCVVEALARVTAPAPPRCPAVSCGAHHPRLGALEVAVHADPGLRNRAALMGGETTDDADLRSRRLWYGCDQTAWV